MKLSDMTGHVLTIGLAGMIACSHAQPAPDASAKQDETKQEQAQPEAKPTAEEYHAQGQADLDKALEQLRGVSVFFEFDSATLTKEAQEKLSNVANVLTAHQELKVRIEGNCDERGSGQYNLALGQRRADSAKKYLATLGVHSGQITAISFGAEKPKALGHDEDAWKQNRRDDLTARR
ncbi:MAG: peptidoglycan-associated lipoprotein Pal [Deltaproteobacteria bacterium]|nr:MAG: peptidoglycan-associated lipoprotein Pal [Deltaproteobacteria bacterium]